MSVTTTCDEHIEKMRKDIDTALKSTTTTFKAVIIDKDWGADEFTDEFKRKLIAAQNTLLALAEEIGSPRCS